MPTASLTTLTPIHIGSGQTLQRGFDFVQKNGQVGFLDLDLIVERIGEASIPQLTAQIEQRKPLMDLPALRNIPLEKVSTYIAIADGNLGANKELKTHYRTAMQGVCIPGSSIKGALKTVLFEQLASKEMLSELPIDDFGFRGWDHRRQQNVIKWKDAKIETRLFGKSANEKSTRFLKVGDCAFGENQMTKVCEVGIYNLGKSWQFKNESLLVEAIPAGAKASFELKLDQDWLHKNRNTYPEKWTQTDTEFISGGIGCFCQKINEYTKRQLNYEFDDLEYYHFDDDEEGQYMLDKLDSIYKQIDQIQQSGANSFVLRIGGHNGWNFTTGGWIKKIEQSFPENERNSLRLAIQKKDRTGINLWPKTRKMTMRGEPLGFVKVNF